MTTTGGRPIRNWPWLGAAVERRISRGGLLLALATLLPACEIANPVELTVDDVDPWLLTNGAIEQMYHAHYGIAHIVMIASDEASWVDPRNSTAMELDRTGDLLGANQYARSFATFSHARELTTLAMRTARERGQAQAERRAQLWYAWALLRSAETFGDQPIEVAGDVLPAAAVVATAARSFREAAEAEGALSRTDRHRALAGIARAEWLLGREDGSPERLDRAVEAATEVTADDAGFAFVIPYLEPFLGAWSGPLDRGELVPSPHFREIPGWWRDPDAPKGAKLVDADELHLIVAEVMLWRDDLPAARATLQAAPILARNHVGVVRQRVAGEPPLTGSAVESHLAGLGREEIQHAIDELRREVWYGHGRRNVGPNGPLMPTGAPAGSW